MSLAGVLGDSLVAQGHRVAASPRPHSLTAGFNSATPTENFVLEDALTAKPQIEEDDPVLLPRTTC